MSRSIHRTRRDLENEIRADYAEGLAYYAARVASVESDLSHKRHIKRQVRQERQRSFSPAALPVEALPIRRRAAGPYVHFPATPEDIRETLRRLPAGVGDGLTSIALCLACQQRNVPKPEMALACDPFVHRVGIQILPQVFVGHPLGVYFVRSRKIQLYAYVYDPQMPDREMWEVYLRFRMLATLVHEVAHHQDFMTRRGRGRWLGQNSEKNEEYAEQTTLAWVEQTVVSYLQSAYPTATQALERWLSHHLGLPISLAFLGAAPVWEPIDETVQTRCPAAWEALREVILGAAQGAPLATTQFAFAEYLDLAERPREALQVVDRVLGDAPGHLAARSLKACLLLDQSEHQEAERLARSVLAEDDQIADAWQVLATVCLAGSRWSELPEVTSRGQAAARLQEGCPDWFVYQRGLAYLMLGQFPELEEDLQELRRAEWPWLRSVAQAMRAAMLLFQERFADAHACAVAALDAGPLRLCWETAALAVRVVAANRQNLVDDEVESILDRKLGRLTDEVRQNRVVPAMLDFVRRILALRGPGSAAAPGCRS